MSQTIVCPNCNVEIDLDKIANHKYDELLKDQENKLKSEQEKQKAQFEKDLEEKTNEMRKKAGEFAERKAAEERKKVELEMKDMQDRLKKSEIEQQEAKKKELELINMQKDLENKEKNFELEMEKKMIEEKKKLEQTIEEKLKLESKKESDTQIEKIQEEHRKKDLEMLKQQEQMKKTIDDLKRKSEQNSQQIQGDIQEDDLKQAISSSFPIDIIEDVPTGIKGADIIQNVKNNLGQPAGVIVWESKNTKAWTDAWVMKLKDDKLKVNGNIAILVTTVLPKNLKSFGMVDDVMVCLPEYVIAVATMLRDKLLAIAKVETSLQGKDLKMEMLYKYLSSEEFSSKISMMVDVFAQLKTGIDSERRAMDKNWKKREKDLERATFAITGMYGELESLMGQALPGAEKLELGAGDDFED
ncbi:DUF2130 domain-containing protein [Candidatus Gracilibacteria bacterium 28_42_T64]|nr:DUF2130 domain-containing protein [Candidatus Gracilibacteria bacterium 28_42_T64]